MIKLCTHNNVESIYNMSKFTVTEIPIMQPLNLLNIIFTDKMTKYIRFKHEKRQGKKVLLECGV